MSARRSTTISPFDAWVLARLVAAVPTDGELAVLSEPAKAIGKHLADLDVKARPSAWRAMMAARDDRDDLIWALASVDPLGPAPEPGADEVLPVVMRAASEIEPLPVEWLWKPRLPLGMLSLFAGDPKLGKSFVTTAIAAAVSRGADLPGDDRPVEPASVILMSAEDDPARTIVPRLKADGANREKVHILEAVIREDGSTALPSLRYDIERIGEAAEHLSDCRLVIIDPVSAYLGGVDDHRNTELRGVLSPLKWLAQRFNLTVVLVSHLNKGASLNGQHRVTGSIAYVGPAGPTSSLSATARTLRAAAS
jgi:hypothetical protein